MPFAKLNGIDLYYETYGSGPPLLFIHGLGSNHLHWWQQVRAFSKNFQIITYDQRGFGFSSDDGQGPSMFPDDAVALLDHLGIEKVALVGQSLGGYTVGIVAARIPHRVSAIALTGSPAAWVAPVQQSQRTSNAIRAARNYEELISVLTRTDSFPERAPDLCFLFEQMAQLNRGVDIRRLNEIMSMRVDPQIVRDAGIPLKLLVGEEDDIHVAAMTEMCKHFPGVELEVVPGAGHLFFFEKADTYNTLIGDFLKQRLL